MIQISGRVLSLAAILLILTAVSFAGAATADTGSCDEKVITTSASGETLATPDRAQKTLSVQTENADVLVAQQANAKIMDGLINSLLGAGIPRTDIQTIGYSIYPVYDENPGPFGGSKVKYYQVTSTIQVTVRDITKTGEVIDLAVSNGANGVNSIVFMLSEELERSLRAEVLTKAVNMARTDANTVAAATGTTIIGMKQATVGSVYVPVYYENARYLGAADMKTSAVPTPIEPGQIKVTAQVTVTYLIQ